MRGGDRFWSWNRPFSFTVVCTCRTFWPTPWLLVILIDHRSKEWENLFKNNFLVLAVILFNPCMKQIFTNDFFLGFFLKANILLPSCTKQFCTNDFFLCFFLKSNILLPFIPNGSKKNLYWPTRFNCWSALATAPAETSAVFFTFCLEVVYPSLLGSYQHWEVTILLPHWFPSVWQHFTTTSGGRICSRAGGHRYQTGVGTHKSTLPETSTDCGSEILAVSFSLPTLMWYECIRRGIGYAN